MRPDLTLYFITDSTGTDDKKLCHTVEEACKGGATIIQLREKNCSGREYLRLAVMVKNITERYNIPLIIDDRADVALASGAAGVHVGSEDIPIADIRRFAPTDFIIGATAKTVEAALKTEADGADYIGTGAIYPTATKVKTIITEVSVLKEICKAVNIPVCAIGGLNADNCDILENSGISGIAVVSAIMKSGDPKAAAERLREKVKRLI